MKVQRVVELGDIDDIVERFERSHSRRLSLRRLPVRDRRDARQLPAPRRVLLLPAGRSRRRRSRRTRRASSREDWARLTPLLAHATSAARSSVYSARYLQTSGQIYWSDAQLSAAYVDDYHADLDRAIGARVAAPR